MSYKLVRMKASVIHDTINIGGGYEPDEVIMDVATGARLSSKDRKSSTTQGSTSLASITTPPILGL